MTEYYEKDSDDFIKIIQSDDEIVLRPVEVKDMKVKDDRVIQELRRNPDKLWTVKELRELEGW